MAHKTLIGGTAYEIGGGKTLVNGTGYSIDKGKTLVGGTAYEVGFAEMVTIVITGSGGDYACVIFDGVTYDSAATLEVPIGTNLQLKIVDETGGGAYVYIVNGEDDFDYYYTNGLESRVVDYTVVGDVSIELKIRKTIDIDGYFFYGVINVRES